MPDTRPSTRILSEDLLPCRRSGCKSVRLQKRDCWSRWNTCGEKNILWASDIRDRWLTERAQQCLCKYLSDVSATTCDAMMTLVSTKTRLKTQGLFDPSEVCANRGQTVYCTIELCLSVDKLEKDNKQGKKDVCVQCLCNVHSVTCWKLWPLTLLLNCPDVSLKVAQLSSFLSRYRSFHSQYPSSYHHQPCPDVSSSAQMCDTNLCRTSCQYQMSNGSPLLKIGFACFSDCSFVFTMWVVSVWSILMSSPLLLFIFRWLSSWFLFVLRRNWIRPDLIHCELSLRTRSDVGQTLLHLRMEPFKLIICDM